MNFLSSRREYFSTLVEGISVVGVYVPDRDSVHVGLCWNFDGYHEVVHFCNTNDVKLQPVTALSFEKYFFSKLSDFEPKLIDSLMAVSELISQNIYTDMILDLKSVVYIGGVFDIASGKYLRKTGAESFINCGVFVMALLETYDYKLLDWNSWPKVTMASRSSYLEGWLDYWKIPDTDRDQFYNFNKEIRGFHVLASSESGNIESNFNEVDPSSKQVLRYLKCMS